MKITAKTTKEQLKNFLGANVRAVREQDKDLFDRIAYADRMAKTDDSKVTRKDLADLAKEVIALLGNKCVEALTPQVATPVVVENSTKKLTKASKKTKTEEVGESEKTAEETQEAPVETKQEAPAETKAEEKVDEKKSAKKSLGKKKEQPKKDGVTALESVSDKAVQMAKMFPQTITVGENKYELASDIKTMEDLYNALQNEQEIVFAYYWTKRHLKQFPYFEGFLGQPKFFDNDLDLATTIYVSDEKKVAYSVSMYTEAVYSVFPSGIEETDGVRFSNGIEFHIYRAV